VVTTAEVRMEEAMEEHPVEENEEVFEGEMEEILGLQVC
jgi:hypothetical protein